MIKGKFTLLVASLLFSFNSVQADQPAQDACMNYTGTDNCHVALIPGILLTWESYNFFNESNCDPADTTCQTRVAINGDTTEGAYTDIASPDTYACPFSFASSLPGSEQVVPNYEGSGLISEAFVTTSFGPAQVMANLQFRGTKPVHEAGHEELLWAGIPHSASGGAIQCWPSLGGPAAGASALYAVGDKPAPDESEIHYIVMAEKDAAAAGLWDEATGTQLDFPIDDFWNQEEPGTLGAALVPGEHCVELNPSGAPQEFDLKAVAVTRVRVANYVEGSSPSVIDVDSYNEFWTTAMVQAPALGENGFLNVGGIAAAQPIQGSAFKVVCDGVEKVAFQYHSWHWPSQGE